MMVAFQKLYSLIIASFKIFRISKRPVLVLIIILMTIYVIVFTARLDEAMRD